MKTILLKFNKTLTKLAGNTYGQDIYEKQIKKQYSYGEKFKIIFPDEIDNIASSFIQGFFGELVNKIGIQGIKDDIEIESKTIKELKEYIIDNLI